MKRIRLPIAGRWLTFAETKRLQLIATKQERDAFLQSLAKTLRKRRVQKRGVKRSRKCAASTKKHGAPTEPTMIETDEQLEARLWKT